MDKAKCLQIIMHRIRFEGDTHASKVVPFPPTNRIRKKAFQILSCPRYAAQTKVYRLAHAGSDYSAPRITHNRRRKMVVVRNTNKEFVTHKHPPQ